MSDHPVKHAVFAAKTRTMMRESRRTFESLLEHDRLTTEALAAMERERAIAAARFAMGHTAFYRDFYRDAGITPEDLRDPAAFESLPIVEKAHVNEHREQFRSDEWSPRTAQRITTGGSTGRPLTLERDKRIQPRGYEWRLQHWWGIEPEDDTGIVYRMFRTKKMLVQQQVLWWPSRRFHLNAMEMNPDDIMGFIETCRKVRPRFLIGYVGGIVELARFIAAHREPIPAPHAVAVTAAPLTPAQRTMIQSVLQAPVYDHYRCAEFNWMAGECERQDGLHVFTDLKRVEVLRADDTTADPGEPGRTVVSDFTNRVFPLIRYRLGDRTARIAEPCACGRPFPRIESIHGRVSDVLRMKSGKVLPGEALSQLFKTAIDEVEQYQVHQHADGSITVKVVQTDAPDADAAVDRVISTLRGIAGPETQVELQKVADIPHDGGKIRYIKSDVPAPQV